uniref:TNFR-Cys domain-containing protein n=1 Tax=Gadus morhua TaxID=8049 RepID=A0A8C4Z1Q2_GADMO
LLIYLLLFVCNFTDNATASANCRPAEYSTEEGCCPTCPPGMYVSRHCNQSRSTSCASCKEGTFQDGDNGREQCFSCQHCDAGLGLKVKKSCSSTSDAVCGVLDGFFCSDSNGGGCRAAQTHTVCSPGQYIDQTGWCQNSLLNPFNSIRDHPTSYHLICNIVPRHFHTNSENDHVLIKHLYIPTGTADKDIECLHCTDGTFSNGTSSSCQNHTK